MGLWFVLVLVLDGRAVRVWQVAQYVGDVVWYLVLGDQTTGYLLRRLMIRLLWKGGSNLPRSFHFGCRRGVIPQWPVQ
jgi:hypothetical protein